MSGVKLASVEPEGIAAAYDPIEVLVDGGRVVLQVDAEHASFELTADKAFRLADALHEGACLLVRRNRELAAVAIRSLVKCIESLEGGKVRRPELEDAKRWLAEQP